MEWIPEAISALIAAVALIVAFVARADARRANELVGVYSRANWTATLEFRDDNPSTLLTLHNRGASPARDVRLRLIADPLATFTSTHVAEFVPKGDTAKYSIETPGIVPSSSFPLSAVAAAAWDSYFESPARREAIVEWIDLEGRLATQRIALPTRQ